MTPIFHVLHVSGVIILLGICFAAAANPVPERRKKSLMFAGIASMVVFIAGFGLLGMFQYGFPGWIMVKMMCWFGISALSGIYFRKPEQAPKFLGITIALAVVAVSMVYLRPF